LNIQERTPLLVQRTKLGASQGGQSEDRVEVARLQDSPIVVDQFSADGEYEDRRGVGIGVGAGRGSVPGERTPRQLVGRQGKLALDLEPQQALLLVGGGLRYLQPPERHASGADGADGASPRLPGLGSQEVTQFRLEALATRFGQAPARVALQADLEPALAVDQAELVLADIDQDRSWGDERESVHRLSR
jgi:hypothetical protein